MRALQNIASAIAGAVAVLLLFEMIPTGGGAVTARVEPTPPRTVVVNQRSDADLSALRHDLASLRGEIASLDTTSPPPVVASSAATIEQIDAADTAARVVSRAVAVGHWTETDRESLRGAMGQMQADDREALLTAWATAVNEQRLRPDVPPI